MLRWFLAICILSNLTQSYKYQYSRETTENDNTHNGDKEENIEELKQRKHEVSEANNIRSRRVWEHFIETLNTHEHALRMGNTKPQVSSETVKDRTKNVNKNPKWNHLLETLKTKEISLRHSNIGKDSNEAELNRRNLVDWFKNIFYPTERTTITNFEEAYPTSLYRADKGRLVASSGQKAYDNSNPTKYKIDTITTVPDANPTTASIDTTLANNLTLIMTKLVQALDTLNERLKDRSQNKTYFVMEMTPEEVISKNETNSDKDLVDEDKTILRHNETKRMKRHTNISQKKTVEAANVENTTNYIEYLYRNNNEANNTEGTNPSFNETKDVTDKQDDEEILPLNLNTRRSYGPYNIRTKLLAYLKDIFEETTIKLKPATTVKNVFSNDVSFKIGYITANLNNLQSNIARLRSNMDVYASTWNEHEIFEVFDVLKMYHNVVIKLVDSLSFHLRRLRHV